MKIIVTTGTGTCISNHLTKILITPGCDVTALTRYNFFNPWEWLETGLNQPIGRGAKPENHRQYIKNIHTR